MSSDQIVKVVTVINRAGIHTRPASMLVRAAARYEADFYIHKDGFEINGKSIIGVMTLAAEQGVRLTLVFSGDDAEEAAAEIERLFADGFGEQ